jgi:hypothetical protein
MLCTKKKNRKIAITQTETITVGTVLTRGYWSRYQSICSIEIRRIVMFKFALLSLFSAYIFLIQFLCISQVGPDWEIPYAVLKKSRMMLVFGLLLVIISILLVIKSYKSLTKYRLFAKLIYFVLMIIALGVIGLGFSGVLY